MTQNNQNYFSPMYAQMKHLNLNIGTPKNCEKHQKPLSYYNKYKPEKNPVCIDCLAEEAKDLSQPNLYLPYTNLEQDYYYQKKLLLEIIEQSNNIKKYEKHVISFQQLLIRYFSQFIIKFTKEKIFCNLNKTKKGLDFLDKINVFPLNSSQDMMNVLSKFESEKFILENKCADVLGQINKMQQNFLKNHAKIESVFKDLLSDCFEDKENLKDSYQKAKTNQNDNFYGFKTQSNKKNENLMNCVNMKYAYYSNSNISAPCHSINIQNNQDTISNIASPKSNEINQYSPKENINININESPSIPSNININMEKERIFEESPKPKIEQRENTNSNSESIQNMNPMFDSSPKKNHPNSEKEIPKKKEEDSLVYHSHKEKINSLIEKDKNKKVNQSFYQPKRSNNKKMPKLNNSFQRFKPKFGTKKKFEYRQYNQFVQKICKECGASFPSLENSGKNELFCKNCRPRLDEDDGRSRRNISQRDSSYNRERNDYNKYSYRPKNNFISQKKKFGASSSSSHYWNKGKNNYTKKDSSFNSHHFAPKTIHHSSSNFISRQVNRINSPKPFGRPKKFGFNNPISKYKSNKDKDNDNFGIKKYNEKNLKDDFEVDLNSVEESKNNDSDEESEERKEKSFSKTTNDFFRNRSDEDRSNENENNFNEFDNDDNNNDMDDDEKEDIKENEEKNMEEEDNEDDELQIDF